MTIQIAREETRCRHQLDKDMVLFGSINITHEFVNWIIVNVKFYIYRTKLQKKILNKNWNKKYTYR